MLSIAFCLRRAFTGGNDPAFARAGPSPTLCPQPDLNRHTKALAIELQGHKNSPASQPGRGLIHSDAADNRAVPLLPGASLWTTTQKPQGGFPFLTAFDSIIIPLLQGAFEGQFPELAIYKRIAPMIASALKQ